MEYSRIRKDKRDRSSIKFLSFCGMILALPDDGYYHVPDSWSLARPGRIREIEVVVHFPFCGQVLPDDGYCSHLIHAVWQDQEA